MMDRRKRERRVSDEPAQIVFDEQGATLDCTIRDHSQTGACIELGNTRLVPSQFVLRFSSGIVRFCRVAWRTEKRVGVVFG
jgi:PilZ domain-containing protein